MVRPVEAFIMGPAYGGTQPLASALRGLRSRRLDLPLLDVPEDPSMHFVAQNLQDIPGHVFPHTPRTTRDTYMGRFGSRGLRMDCTEINAYWPGALQSIKAMSPNARILYVLREPLERVHHHIHANRSLPVDDFWHETGRTSECLGAEYRLRDAAGVGHHGRANYAHNTEYLRMINEVRSLFDDVLYVDWGEYRSRPRAVIERILQFLHVEGLYTLGTPERQPGYSRERHERLIGPQRAQVWRRCVGDFPAIEGITGIDTDRWLRA